jgi:hypothetical protein
LLIARTAERVGAARYAAQALILGHAVPMSVVIRTRDTHTPEYFASFGYSNGDDLQKKLEKNKRTLGRDGGGID